MICIINCSPKARSNSSHFIQILTTFFDNYKIIKLYNDSIDNVKNLMTNSDTIILVFPLYVDAPPSKLIKLMEQFNDLYLKKVYCISNCGFLEPNHNDVAIKIIKNWTTQNQGLFMGSYKIGSGEVLGKSNGLFFKNKMKRFSYSINQGKKINLSSTLRIPKRVFCSFANKSFKQKLAKCLKK